MLRRPPRSTRTDTPFPPRRSSDLDRFDLHRRGVADRLVIAVADREIFPDRAPERGKRKADRPDARAFAVAKVHDQPPLLDTQQQLERAVAGALKLHDRSKTVFLEQIIDRDPALLLDIGTAPQYGAVVQFYVDDARIAHEPRLSGSVALGKEKHANAPLRRKCNENETLTISRIWLMRGPGSNSGNRR